MSAVATAQHHCADCGDAFEQEVDGQTHCDPCAVAGVFAHFPSFCELLEIRVKEGPPKQFGYDGWFEEQRAFERDRTGRDIVLKPRQVGFTTLELARDLQHAIVNRGHQVLVIVHDDKIAESLFQTLHVFCDSLRDAGLLPKTKYSSKREVVFASPLNSAVRIVEAGATEASAAKKGRSGTIHRLHATEASFWGAAQETIAAALSAVPKSGEVVVESTANGAGGWFYEQVMAAKAGRGRYKLHFYPWFNHAEYRLDASSDNAEPDPSDEWEQRLVAHGCDAEQLAFWRAEVQEKGLDKAAQEYPESAETCFRSSGDSWFAPSVIDRLAKHIREPVRSAPIAFKGQRFADASIYQGPKPGMQYVVGADVSEGIANDGSTATVVDRRTGEVVATWWDDGTPAKDFGLVLAVLGWLYNTATVAPERNNDGKATLVGLSDVAKYPRIFHDASDGRPGWNTTPASRPVMWGDLGYAIRQGAALCADSATVAECRTIIKDSDGRPRARGKRARSADSCRDDRFVSWAIAWQVREKASNWQPGRSFNIRGV